MLGLPSRQALKALRNPFRSPLPNPLRIPLQTRHLHNAAPFSGPPSYATLARRFSASSPGPINFFRQKTAKEAIERGEFVDVHDISGIDPKNYDVLITEVDNNTLHSEISKLVDIPYLKEATKDEADKVAKEIRGFYYGRSLRMIFPCILSMKGQARWVFFIVDSGAPLTYISAEVAQAFGLLDDPEPSDPWDAKIADHAHQIYLSPSDSHFSEVNLLGGDFYKLKEVHPRVSAIHRRITYRIGGDWEPEPKL